MAQSISNLPVGARIKFGKHSVNGEAAWDISWIVVAKNHSSYPSNSITLLTEKIIDLRAYDAAEQNVPGSSDGVGNNDYGLSNINAWLNSESTSWYMSTHTYDTPPNNTNTMYATGYDTRPGFLSNFSAKERSAILSSTISVTKYGATIENLTRKVFLPSFIELGMSIATEPTNGSRWSYFSSATCEARLTQQCFDNTRSSLKPNTIETTWSYWLRSVSSTAAAIVYYEFSTNSIGQTAPHFGYMGVRPAMNVSSSIMVSDTIDSDGCYTCIWNFSPPTPAKLTVPTVYSEKSTVISWSSVTDPDGDVVTYHLERSIDGGTFTTIYTGANVSYTTIVPKGVTSVQFRVKALDTFGDSSEYITSASLDVITNDPPRVSPYPFNLGEKNSEFTHEYLILDADYDTIVVTETIDNNYDIRTYVTNAYENQILDITGKTWLSLTNGEHYVKITPFDGIDRGNFVGYFTKNVSSCSVETNSPIVASTMPTRMKVNVARNIPATALFKVEVCNNGFDESPNWEDATSSVTGGLAHVFSNTTKTAERWGVRIRVSVDRNGATGACYISSIGGNFE